MVHTYPRPPISDQSIDRSNSLYPNTPNQYNYVFHTPVQNYSVKAPCKGDLGCHHYIKCHLDENEEHQCPAGPCKARNIKDCPTHNPDRFLNELKDQNNTPMNSSKESKVNFRFK